MNIFGENRESERMTRKDGLFCHEFCKTVTGPKGNAFFGRAVDISFFLASSAELSSA